MLLSRLCRMAGALALGALLSACATAPAGGPADVTPRVAVISAFQPELSLLLGRVEQPRKQLINGVEFTTCLLYTSDAADE